MTPEDTEQIRKALNGDEERIPVVVLPARQLGTLFGGVPHADGNVFSADLTIEEYQERYAPALSPSRIRELCATGEFPDSVSDDGAPVPGAYKMPNGTWRITMEGIVARQAHDRAEGLKWREQEQERKQRASRMKKSTQEGHAKENGTTDTLTERDAEEALQVHESGEHNEDLDEDESSPDEPDGTVREVSATDLPRPLTDKSTDADRPDKDRWKKILADRLDQESI